MKKLLAFSLLLLFGCNSNQATEVQTDEWNIGTFHGGINSNGALPVTLMLKKTGVTFKDSHGDNCDSVFGYLLWHRSSADRFDTNRIYGSGKVDPNPSQFHNIYSYYILGANYTSGEYYTIYLNKSFDSAAGYFFPDPRPGKNVWLDTTLVK